MNLSRLIFAINIIISCLRKSPIKHVLFTACMNRLYMYIILKMKGFCFVCNTQFWSYFWSNRSLFHFFSRSQRSPLNCSTQFWISFKKKWRSRFFQMAVMCRPSWILSAGKSQESYRVSETNRCDQYSDCHSNCNLQSGN